MVRWTAHRMVRMVVRSAAGRFVLRLLRELADFQLVDRGMTLAAHVFTSVLPILIVAGAVRSQLDAGSGPIFAEHLGLDTRSARLLEDSLPGGAQELRATGVIGIVLLLIAATSFARALERSLRTIWRTGHTSIRLAWRWVAAVITVILGLALVVASRTVLRGAAWMLVVEFLAELIAWSLLWWVTAWVVVGGRIGLRQLLPGAVLTGLGFAVAGLVGRVALPPLLADSASRFGVLGMAFTYIGWLLVLACILLIATTAGRILYLTRTGQAWRRSASPARNDVPADNRP
jgi:membrane protein